LVDLPGSRKVSLRADFRALAAALVVAICTLIAAGLEGGLLGHPAVAAGLLFAASAAWLFGSSAAVVNTRHVLAALLALRLLSLFAAPTLSDDVYRYVHEGRASRLGLAVPYQTPPSQITPPPDDGTTAKVNHPEVPAAYPPASQLLLLLTVGLGDAFGAPRAGIRLALALCDALIVWLLWQRRRARPRAFLLYGLHPLPLLEACIGSHLDALGAALVVAAVLAVRRSIGRGLLVGLALGVKPTALLALIGGPLRRRAIVVACAGVFFGALLPTVPYLVVDAPLTRGLVEYSTRWEAQPTLYAIADGLLSDTFLRREQAGTWAHAHVTRTGVVVEEGGVTRLAIGSAKRVARPLLLDGRVFARGIALALLLAGLALCVRLRDPYARVAWAFTALWLVAPTMHPWYLLWCLPFAALANARGILLWGLAAPLAYEAAMAAAATGVWQESSWPRVVGLAALTTGTALDLVASRRSASPTSSAPASTD
jgi:hypothetical protein